MRNLFNFSEYSKLKPESAPENLTLKEELQLQAVPQLGNVKKAIVRIHENKEFKVSKSGKMSFTS